MNAMRDNPTQHEVWLESGVFVEPEDAELSQVELARDMAAREFYMPDYGIQHDVNLSYDAQDMRNRNRYRLLAIADTPGNWWDKLKWYQRLCAVAGVILAAGLLVGYAR